MNVKLNNHVVGNAGLYYACYQLSLRGWNAMPTARNARGVDIIAYNTSGTHFIGLQVKSLSIRNPVPLGKSLDKLMGNYWVIVNRISTQPTAYIMLPHEVKALAHRGERNGKVSYWLQPRSYDCDDFRNKWDRLPTAHE
jgi:hypothetical protein